MKPSLSAHTHTHTPTHRDISAQTCRHRKTCGFDTIETLFWLGWMCDLNGGGEGQGSNLWGLTVSLDWVNKKELNDEKLHILSLSTIIAGMISKELQRTGVYKNQVINLWRVTLDKVSKGFKNCVMLAKIHKTEATVWGKRSAKVNWCLACG